MKAEELMLGDFVRVGNRTNPYDTIVCEIDDEFCVVPTIDGNEKIKYADLFPIPLTPEILEKNGFVFNGTNKWESHESGFDAFVVPVQPDNEWWDEYSTRIEVCTRRADMLIEAVEQIFVHQLQQFIRLCGINKTIEL